MSDVDLIVKQLINDLLPGQVSDQIPGLPAHLLFMCVRYCDHVNDDEKLQTLLTSAITAIGIVTKVTKIREQSLQDVNRLVSSCSFFTVHNDAEMFMLVEISERFGPTGFLAVKYLSFIT